MAPEGTIDLPDRLCRRARRVRRGRRPRRVRRRRADGRSAASARCSRPSPAAARAAGVVPIENVINGTVRENYDLLLEHDLADPRRGRRAGQRCASRRCPASGSTTSSGSTRTSRRSARPRRSCARGRGSCSRPTTRRAPARPSPTAASAAPRPSCRRGRRRCSGWRSSPTRSATSPGNRTRFLVLAPPGGAGRSGSCAEADGAPDDARRRGPQRARDAARGAARVRRPRPEHAQARVAAEPRARLGVRLLDRPRRRHRRSGDRRGARGAGRRHDDGARPGQLPGGAGTPDRAVRRSRRWRRLGRALSARDLGQQCSSAVGVRPAPRSR